MISELASRKSCLCSSLHRPKLFANLRPLKDSLVGFLGEGAELIDSGHYAHASTWLCWATGVATDA